jgi:predicted MFS family arabinose efflux permease
MKESKTESRRQKSIALQVGTAVVTRIVLNTARRFAYPFAPALSRGLSVPLTAVTSMIAVNQLTSVLGILFGPLADRLGYRRMMCAGLAVLAAGMFAGGLFPFFFVILAALFLAGLGKTIFDPAIQAHVGERVPIQRRGLAIGLLEVSWAGSTLLGIPLIGILIDGYGWRAPFLALAGCGVLGIAALRIVIPRDEVKPLLDPAGGAVIRRIKGLLRDRASMSLLAFSFFINMANDHLFVVYGAWLEDAFELGILALGFGTSVIGAAELCGEFLVAALSDRLGLRRALIIGVVVSSLTYVALPLVGVTLPLALGSIFVVFLAYEFTIVTGITMSTELLPHSRATLVAGFMAAAGLGRVCGALLGGPVWLAGGILATGLASAGLSALGLAALGVGGMKKGA